MDEVANTGYGRLFSIAGTSAASSANIEGDTRPTLTPLVVRLMIEILVTSLPVPQVVGT